MASTIGQNGRQVHEHGPFGVVDLRTKGIARKAPVGFIERDGGGLLGNDAMCAFLEIGKLFVSQGIGDYGKTVAVKEGGSAVDGVWGNRFEGEHGISSVVGRA